jgi:hypothetical protein
MMAAASAFGRLAQSLHDKRFEPRQRNKDGMRWIGHRFPIKGGISMRDVWMREMCRPNPLLRLVKQ